MSKIKNQCKNSNPSLSLRGVELATRQSSIDCFVSHTRNDETASSYKKGFGLLEVLISAVIIIIILSALITIGRASMNNNEYLAERAQAIYLAQESIEMVGQIRDTNWIDGDSDSKWNTLAYNSATSSFFIPDSTKSYRPEYIASQKRILLTELAAGENILVPVAAPSVTFNRKIKVETANDSLIPSPSGSNLSNYAIKVTGTVTWTYSGQSKSVTLSEILTNWRPDF